VRGWQRVALAMFAVGWGANQFSPLLIAYRDELGMGVQTRAFLFGLYAAGLIPALLVGGVASDRWGRRAVVVPFVALSPLATVVLIVGHDSVPTLALARLLAGVCSGVVFGAASAWVADLSQDDAPGAGARRAAIALSAGFGGGPVVTGLIAQFSPDPLTVPYLPHVVLGVVVTVLLLATPGPAPAHPARRVVGLPRAGRRRFRRGVAPVAPWVFGCGAISFAWLPAEVGGSGGVGFAGVITGVTLAAGIGVQPLARRLGPGASRAGLGFAATGIVLGAVAVAGEATWLLLPVAVVLGSGYGCCLVSGLQETEALTEPAERGATVSLFYALTYLGFAAPFALGVLDGAGLGPLGALGVALVAVAGSAAALRTI
jgi:MFS family permease